MTLLKLLKPIVLVCTVFHVSVMGYVPAITTGFAGITWFSGIEYPKGTPYVPILGERFNYLIPTGSTLRIKSAFFVDKNLGANSAGHPRSSYAWVYAQDPAGTRGGIIFTIPDHAANPQFNPGLEVPGGWLLYGAFANNNYVEEQVMQLTVNGELCSTLAPGLK